MQPANSPDVVIRIRLAELAELTGGYDFAEVIAAYWRGHDPGAGSRDRPIIVYCAASFRFVVEEVAREYTGETGRRVELRFGASEELLWKAGAIGAPGSLDRGTTVSDFDPMERRVQHSLSSSLMNALWPLAIRPTVSP